MQCQYCGKEFLIGFRIMDTDFCCPAHRQRFHQGLATVVRRIQVEGSHRPVGQAGFRVQTAVLDREPLSMSCAPTAPARLRPTGLPDLRLAAADFEVLRDPRVQHDGPAEEIPNSQDETTVSVPQTETALRLKRVSFILSELRGQIEKRRRDAADFIGPGGRAPVIQLKRAV